MSEKSKSGLVICLLILTALFAGMNFGILATELEGDTSAIGSRLGGNDYHWGPIGLLSEPKIGQNINTGYSRDPVVAVEGNKIYLVWEDGNNTNGAGTDADIFYRYFDGNTWSDVQIISEPVEGSNLNTAFSLDPAIAVENGKIYVVWEDANNTNGASGDYDIHYRCNLTGSGWEDVQVISEPVLGTNENTGQSYNPKIAVENGNIYVVWEDSNNTNGAGNSDSDIFFKCNLTGTTWEDVQVISEPVIGSNNNDENSIFADIAVENNNIYVVWQDNNDTYNAGTTNADLFYKCNITGVGWEEVQVISEPVKGSNINVGAARNPEIAVENGNIYVVWDSWNNTNGAGMDSDIFYMCNLTGSGWEELQILSEPIKGADTNTAMSAHPEIAVENGNLFVVWHDRNDTNGAGGDSDVFYTRNLTGSGWEDVQVISEPIEGSDLSTGTTNIACVGIANGKSHVFWHDTNDTYSSGTDSDIQYRITYHAPSLSSGSVIPTVGNTSTNFHFTVTYTDVDNEAPTVMNISISGENYTMLQSAPGDQNFVDGKNYYFDTHLLTIKTYNCKFWTSDGVYNSYTSIVNNPKVQNTIPNITTANVETSTEDVYYEVDYEYEDIDIANIGQVGTWSIQTNAGWLDFNTTTGLLNGTPLNDDVGDYNVNITIDDGRDIDWSEFQLTVEPVNDPPSLITDALDNATEDQYYEVAFVAEDIDTPLLFWNIKTNASWLTVNNTLGRINGTPSNNDVGVDFWVDVTVEDGEYIDARKLSLEVENVNDPPTIITDEVTTAKIDELYQVDFEASDIDPPGDILTWSLNTNASWLTINSSTGVLSGTPTDSNIGTFWVNVTVSDGKGGFDFCNFTLSVPKIPITPPPPTNKNPVITTDNKLTAEVDKLYSVDYNATDEDTPLINLTWSVTTNASWLKINSTSGVLSGTPGAGDVGTYNINVSVSDGAGGLAFTNFVITVKKPVSPPPENNKPKLTSGKISPSKGDTDTEFTFTVQYTDEDGDPPASIQVVIDGKAYDMTLASGNASNGVYEYKTKLAEGDHSYYFTASDGMDAAETGDTTPTTAANAGTTSEIEKVEKKKKDETDYTIYIIIIIIIIIIIVLLAVASRKKKPAVEEKAAPEEEEEREEELEEECVECGAMLAAGERVCPECGAEVPEKPAEAEEESLDEELSGEDLDKELEEDLDEDLEEDIDEDLDEELDEDEDVEEESEELEE